MDAQVLKVEAESEPCCVCGVSSEELCSPEEHDASSPPGAPPLRAVLLHLNNTKIVPSGRLCPSCINRALEAYSFSTMLAAKGPPPLSEKIRALRRRLHELTQKIDVFIVVGGGADGAYSEEDIIMVERDALAAASLADEAEAIKAQNMRGDHVYQCTVCPLTFQRVSEFRAHAASHARGAVHSCWTCGAQFPGAAAARAHAHSHAPARHHCYVCDTTCQSAAALRAHEAACESRCPACGRVFESRAALRAHAAAHDAACDVCLRTFPAGAAAECAAHRLEHRRARHLVCGHDGCILRFSHRSNLLSHIRKCHAPEPAPQGSAERRCAACDRLFASAAALKRHSRVHKADAPAPSPAPAAELSQESMEWGGSEFDGKVEYLEVEALEELEGHNGL